jgi:peptidoglycan hydrolase-like protein with peptidoglycan-binding domain
MLDSEIAAPERTEEPAPPPARKRRGRRGVLIGGAAVLAIGAAGGAYALHDGKSTATTTTSELPTASVTRTNMTSTVDVDGTLGYGGGYTVLAGGTGRITWLPKAGDVIGRGKRVYGADGRTIPLIYGPTPLWRTLSSGVAKGYDVLELERNLKALGYGDDLTVDRKYTWATAQAVEDWQHDLGRARTGEVAPGDVVLMPGAIRVSKVQAVLGGAAAGTVFTASDTTREVTVAVPVSDAQTVARKGAKVRVTLPGGKQATGTIAEVGSVATAASTNASSQTGQGTENATITVTVTLDKSSGAIGLDGAPATVGFTSTEHKNVLVVPVNALLASAGGEYSVAVVDASGAVRSVPVRLGIFDGDNVEVAGTLTAGEKVQVPKS